MDGQICLREMLWQDTLTLPQDFAAQGWNKPQEKYVQYYQEQQAGLRTICVAAVDGRAAGYATLVPQAAEGRLPGSASRKPRTSTSCSDTSGKGLATASWMFWSGKRPARVIASAWRWGCTAGTARRSGCMSSGAICRMAPASGIRDGRWSRILPAATTTTSCCI